MVSGHPKSTGIPQVEGLSTGPLDLGLDISLLNLEIGISNQLGWVSTILTYTTRK